jgi:hypothetical protein
LPPWTVSAGITGYSPLNGVPTMTTEPTPPIITLITAVTPLSRFSACASVGTAFNWRPQDKAACSTRTETKLRAPVEGEDFFRNPHVGEGGYRSDDKTRHATYVQPSCRALRRRLTASTKRPGVVTFGLRPVSCLWLRRSARIRYWPGPGAFLSTPNLMLLSFVLP